jgi:type II secretory pathway pseudopilin PulG
MTGRRRAFTLIEIVLCGVLLFLAVVPFLGLLESMARNTRLTRARIVATSLARNVIERYRVERLAELAKLMPALDDGARAIEADQLLKLPAGPLAELVRAHGFRRSATLARGAAGDPAGHRKGVLMARVDWVEDGHPRTCELKTLIVDDELSTGWLEEAR